jgi:heat shock protein HslJ
MKNILSILLCAIALFSAASVARRPGPISLDRTAWEITAINGKPTQRAPRIEFVRGLALGSTGCNSFEGSYVQNGQLLSFRRVFATEIGCPGAIGAQERALLTLLSPKVQILRGADGGIMLKSGRQTATLRRAANCINCNRLPVAAAVPLPKLVGNDWVIQSINGKPVSLPDKAKISFTATNVSATIGCNRMSGPYRIGKKEYLVTGSLISTLIGCPPGLDKEESALYELLSNNPRIQAERGPRETRVIRLSTGKNQAVIGQIWYIGLD